MYSVSGPKQGLEIEAVVLHRVGFLEYFCPKQGQDFKPSAAPLYPNLGQVPPPPGKGHSKGIQKDGGGRGEGGGEGWKFGSLVLTIFCNCKVDPDLAL